MDAIFGTGFRGMPEDDWAAAIASLNDGGIPIVAIDIPSGVNGSTGVVEGEAVSRPSSRSPSARRSSAPS